MPYVEIKLWDHQVTDESVPKIIEGVTEALSEASGAPREAVWVVVQGVSPKRWGVGGRPGA